MALLHMLATHKQAGQTVVALTVDHGLRAAGAAEAQQVADYCQTLGVTHCILRWTGDKPRTGVQNKARNARRQLLLDKCKELNITDLYLAHQADDKIETLLQRIARGSGPAGLAGIKARSVQQGITLHRPLLQMRRAALRAYCIDNAIPFSDDPSNDDPRFERVRWRAMVQQIERTEPGFGAGILRVQKRMQNAAETITHLAQRWLAEHSSSENGITTLPRQALIQQPHAVIVELLRQLMTTSTDYKVDLERLEDWVGQAFGDQPVENALTLGGWWLQLKKNALVVQRAPARTAL